MTESAGLKATTKTFSFGEQTVTIETGAMARQADAAVLVSIGDTMVLVTAVGVNDASEVKSFLPLTVNYQERTYAAGKIPGGYFKREGRPTEKEILISRLIDRQLRPLFPKGFTCEVQVIATVLSLDPEISADIPAILGASAALALSGIPFDGPLAAARVGYCDGNYVLNPGPEQLESSALDLVIGGTKDAVLMVESEAKELSEEVMLGAVMYGFEQFQAAITAIEALAAEAKAPAWEWEAPQIDAAVVKAVSDLAAEGIAKSYQIQDKKARVAQLSQLSDVCIEQLNAGEEGQPTVSDVKTVFANLSRDCVRSSILAGNARIDGRDLTTVRAINARAGVLPRAHGSAVFTRGETQALVVATLGTEREAQLIDALEGEYRDSFMLHYNFPPYSVGEVGFLSGPKRREIGHGRLAKRAIQAMLPDIENFPYVLRVVSEITESNGSSSMATVCGTSLALMDAGVPVKAPVAGIAMGLIKSDDNFAVLTDILGDEDHLGDMDFKVAGTTDGITALQMDIKISGITREIMQVALNQARDARLHILQEMSTAITTAREDISCYAPRIITIKVAPDKVREVIGKGGATIRALTEETGTSIDIADDGTIKIAAVDQDAGAEAKRRIELITADAEIGKIYEGKVVKLVDFGAFVNFLPGKDGLVHISQINDERVENVSDVLHEGQEVRVKVLDIDRQGRVRLSIKAVEAVAEE